MEEIDFASDEFFKYLLLANSAINGDEDSWNTLSNKSLKYRKQNFEKVMSYSSLFPPKKTSRREQRRIDDRIRIQNKIDEKRAEKIRAENIMKEVARRRELQRVEKLEAEEFAKMCNFLTC